MSSLTEEKEVGKRGLGYIEIQIYLSCEERKYIGLGRCAKEESDIFLSQYSVKDGIKHRHDSITAMSLFKNSITISNFDIFIKVLKTEMISRIAERLI